MVLYWRLTIDGHWSQVSLPAREEGQLRAGLDVAAGRERNAGRAVRRWGLADPLSPPDECDVALARDTNEVVQELHLSYLGVSNEGAIALANMLGVNHVLKKLYLEKTNAIGNEGAIALGKALTTNGELEELDLRFNQISQIDGLIEELGPCQSLKILNISNNPIEQTMGTQSL